MGNMAIMRPYANAAIGATTGTWTGTANLLTNDPKEAAIASSGTPSIIIDLGATMLIDSFFLSGAFAAGTTYTVGLGTLSNGSDAVAVATGRAMPTTLQARGVANDILTFTAQSKRYVSLTITTSASATVALAVCGRAFIPTYGREYGSGRPIFDTGSAESLISGGFGINTGVRKSGFQFTLGDLTNAEVETLFTHLLVVGTTNPAIVAEDITPGAGFSEGIHYGVFTKIDTYERANVNLNKYNLILTEWV